MNYYPFNIADYYNGTRHLKIPEEHYIYRSLLDMYYDKEAPLPVDKRRLARFLGLTSDQLPLLDSILDDFFDLREDGWHNDRCDHEIEIFRSYINKQKAAGTASGKARRANGRRRTTVQPPFNDCGTPVKVSSTTVEPNQEPRTKNQSGSEKSEPTARARTNGKFNPPTIDEVQTYLDGKNIKSFKAETFVTHYEANGWARGKTKMKDWRAACRYWHSQRQDDDRHQKSDFGQGGV